MPKLKYTKDFLEPIVRESLSVRSVVSKLGLRVNAGGTNSYISKKIKEFGIDTSHFLGQGANAGNRHKGGFLRKSADEILVLRETGDRNRSTQLRRALLEIGRKYVCYVCNLFNWRGKKIVLEIEHKNGNPLDDRRENLEFICPNCHSQTETFCRKLPD